MTNDTLQSPNREPQSFVCALRQLFDVVASSSNAGEESGKVVSSHLAMLAVWVFETMTQLKPEALEMDSVLPAEFFNSVSATVNFVGTYSGSVSIHCPAPLAGVLAGYMSGQESVGEQKDIPDAMGELASVIAGEIKLGLSVGGLDIQLSTPEVVSGQHYALSAMGHRQVTINFKVNGEPIYIALLVYRNRLLQIAAEELRNKREWLTLALEGGKLGLWKWDLETGKTLYSDEWATMLGYEVENLVSDVKTWESLMHPEDVMAVHTALQEYLAGRSSHCEVEHRLLSKSGDWRWIMSRGRAVGHLDDGSPKQLVGTNLDITVIKEAELAVRKSEQQLKLLNEQLEERVVDEVGKNREKDAIMLHQDKLASIGQLAAGVAHEINNPMGFIMSNLRTLSNYAEAEKQYQHALENAVQECCSEKVCKQLEKLAQQLDLPFIRGDIPSLISESLDGAERIRQIVLDLKDFAHSNDGRMEESDLNHCIQSTANMVRNEIRYVADLNLRLGSIPLVVCNPQQINQVIANLLVNAAQAMKDFGAITVTTSHEQGHVMLTIVDTGCGITPEIVDKIYDPFFTTKDIGKGTGLGLSISYGIIKKHGGEIKVQSELGVGTTFVIILPINGPEAV
ncbi:MAG: PAS domain-containing protein [Deltaproteobacteria bacterium]|nr:PAS domain-containing protein [Deltaproteobacteria bacterium]